LPARLVEFYGRDLVVDELEAAIGGNDIDMVRLELFVVLHLHHRHSRAKPKNVGQLAALFRVEMDDDDIGGAASLGQCADEGLQCLHAAG
jgi:hypothetical protein